jgi:hypothetical protein
MFSASWLLRTYNYWTAGNQSCSAIFFFSHLCLWYFRMCSSLKLLIVDFGIFWRSEYWLVVSWLLLIKDQIDLHGITIFLILKVLLNVDKLIWPNLSLPRRWVLFPLGIFCTFLYLWCWLSSFLTGVSCLATDCSVYLGQRRRTFSYPHAWVLCGRCGLPLCDHIPFFSTTVCE